MRIESGQRRDDAVSDTEPRGEAVDGVQQRGPVLLQVIVVSVREWNVSLRAAVKQQNGDALDDLAQALEVDMEGERAQEQKVCPEDRLAALCARGSFHSTRWTFTSDAHS